MVETLCHGVCRLNNTSIPQEVLQNNKPNPSLADKLQGQSKAAVLIDDDTYPNLLTALVYNQKSITVLSTIAESMEGVLAFGG